MNRLIEIEGSLSTTERNWGKTCSIGILLARITDPKSLMKIKNNIEQHFIKKVNYR